MKDEIAQLKALQAIDLEISALEEQLAAVDSELDQRRQTISDYQQEGEQLREKQSALQQRKQELETSLEEDLEKIRDRQAKMMNIQTNREYQSLLKESDDAKKANKEREDELLRIAEELEEIEKKITELDNLRSGEEKLLKEDTKKAEKRHIELTGSKEKIIKKRNTKVKNVPPAMLKKYDTLRERRNGLALAGVEAGVCRGCFMNIPPQLYNDLLKEEQLLLCPTCNRIMFPQAAEETEKA
ncbi:zinc ribbon domain-containing protein [Desulfurivibrio dismutans]|uniref:zinc ribbon domain-containing protein n=1 Tax=Desulfurivibrio dismutans TaxID=1398908 RepID=UPI0023DB9B48|nr:C4-type zinc ribbon domain-containing protein [Desulfurivibrio alkaliphilus]MDF1614199.1 C4-type zinc ribbon domain-containing protein [Desulfurivibrio alkaliphilus]